MIPGASVIEVPSGAKQVRIAGEISFLHGDTVYFRVGAAVGRCGRGKPQETHYRRVPGFSPISERIIPNRRGTCAGIVIKMKPGHEFEARGYSANSQMVRYRFDGETVIKV